MLPSFLFPSYKQYKADTDEIANWLAKTAARCGYPQDLLIGQGSTQSKIPKLKGRARKLAREAAKTVPTGGETKQNGFSTLGADSKYFIAIKDFISLAQWISQSATSGCIVPKSFVNRLDRTITVRKRHQDWWYGQRPRNGDNGDVDNINNNHAYFISVLEQVRSILHADTTIHDPRDTSNQHAEPAISVECTRELQMFNLFANLEVEEPLQSDSAADPKLAPADTFRPDTRLAEAAQYGLKQELDHEEVYFAVHCFFNDMNNIRKYLQQIWQDYKTGAVDLISVSVVTNTACEFVKGMHDDFVQTFPQHTDFEKHLKVLHKQQCVATGMQWGYRERPRDAINFALYDYVEPLLVPTFMILLALNRMLQQRKTPLYGTADFDTYEAGDRGNKSARDKFQEDDFIASELLPEICVLAKGISEIAAEDELTRGIRDMIKHGRPSIWLTFTFQVFLDIHHILQTHVTHGFRDLMRSVDYINSSLVGVLTLHKDLKLKEWPRFRDDVLLNMQTQIRYWVKDDAVDTIREQMIRPSVLSPPAQPHRLLRNHPLYCGLLSFWFKTMVQEAAIVFINDMGFVLGAAHLYNALRQERLLTQSWDDMDIVLSVHKTEDIFVGDFPRTIEDYFKRCSLAEGFSATLFAAGRRALPAAKSKAGPRKLNKLCPILHLFRSRFCQGEVRPNMSPDDFDLVLKKFAEIKVHSSNSRPVGDHRARRTDVKKVGNESFGASKLSVPKDILNDTAEPSEYAKDIHFQSLASPGMRPVQLLSTLLESLEAEIPELSFNHFCVHATSWHILLVLKDKMGKNLRHLYGAKYDAKEHELSFVAPHVFLSAHKTNEISKGASASKRDKSFPARTLETAADVMKEILDSGDGATEVALLKTHLGVEIKTRDLFGTPRLEELS